MDRSSIQCIVENVVKKLGVANLQAIASVAIKLEPNTGPSNILDGFRWEMMAYNEEQKKNRILEFAIRIVKKNKITDEKAKWVTICITPTETFDTSNVMSTIKVASKHSPDNEIKKVTDSTHDLNWFVIKKSNGDEEKITFESVVANLVASYD